MAPFGEKEGSLLLPLIIMNEITKKWVKYYKRIGIKDEFIEEYIPYIDTLSQKNMPIIFDLRHLSGLVSRKVAYLASVINATQHHYRSFKIIKRRGGYREISAPYPALLECQQWINEYILRKIPLHPSSHGFTNSKSIISNAKTHLNQQCLLKLDLKDFFSSISKAQVIRVFKNIGYNNPVSYYLASICCLKNCLPQGAATSPSLSNIVSFGLDVRLKGLASSYGLNYSRYADDMTFSGKHIPIKLIDVINEIVEEQGFLLNDEKTSLVKGKRRKIVTGISVASEKPKLPRGYKRKLKQEVYYIKKHGISSHIEHGKLKEPFYLDIILGRLSFWKFVEPDSEEAEEHIKYFKNLIADQSYDY